MTTDTATPMAQPRQRKHEAPALGSAAARMIRALVVRAAEGDTEALEQLAALEQLLPQATALAGHHAHAWGYSFSELAAVLGISRQAAIKRFSARPLSPEPPHSWPMDWFTRRLSSGEVMRQLVTQLSMRRAQRALEALR